MASLNDPNYVFVSFVRGYLLRNRTFKRGRFFVGRKEHLDRFIIFVLFSSLAHSLCDQYDVQIRP